MNPLREILRAIESASNPGLAKVAQTLLSQSQVVLNEIFDLAATKADEKESEQSLPPLATKEIRQ